MVSITRCDRCDSADRPKKVDIKIYDSSSGISSQYDLCYDCRQALDEFMGRKIDVAPRAAE